MSEIIELINSFSEEIFDTAVKIRRHIHKNPELSLMEYNTMEFICSYLDKWNISYQSRVYNTGVVAVINGAKSGNSKTLLLRADTDALPICEKNDTDYKSIKDGVMHACGHDVHTSILLGTAYILNKMSNHFSGSVKFIFQPGEETTGGAKKMIEEGVLKNPNVNACLSLHCDTDIDVGKIRIKEGPLYASPDEFYVKIKGKGGHAAEPEKCIDPLKIAAICIPEIDNISNSESVTKTGAVAVTGFNAGKAPNVITDEVEFFGSSRALTPKTRIYLEKHIEECIKEICNKYGGEYTYEYVKLYPPLVNDANLSSQVFNSSKEIIGFKNCILGGEATMAGEDFAYFSEKLPSVMIKLGCKNAKKNCVYPIHSSMFDVDEEAILVGLKVFTNFALNFLN